MDAFIYGFAAGLGFAILMLICTAPEVRNFLRYTTSCAWSWLKWGKLREVTKSIDGGYVSEYAVVSQRTGDMVGYWAYGSFDPTYPYQGQSAIFIN